MDTDLSLVSLDAMLKEIGSRFETCVLGLHKDLGNGKIQERRFVLGDLRVCQGLAFSLSAQAEQMIAAHQEDAGPEHQA